MRDDHDVASFVRLLSRRVFDPGAVKMLDLLDNQVNPIAHLLRSLSPFAAVHLSVRTPMSIVEDISLSDRAYPDVPTPFTAPQTFLFSDLDRLVLPKTCAAASAVLLQSAANTPHLRSLHRSIHGHSRPFLAAAGPSGHRKEARMSSSLVGVARL